jgi:cation/acetate symporter
VLCGVISSIGLIIISPEVWPGPDSEGGLIGFWDLANPGIVSIPLGFLGCWLGTVLSSERTSEERWHELYVRSETGLGAEAATTHGLIPRPRRRPATAVTTTQTMR